MNMLQSIKTCFSKYLDFNGRATRSEYWWFQLFNILIILVLGYFNFVILANLYSLATFFPSLAVFARRMHDTNRSGWFILLALIPIIGWLVLLYFTVSKGTEGDNFYGPPPLL
jgi:uncharacterized membrane protein YhaH (DUF805 family)